MNTSNLSEKQIERYRKALEEKRSELIGDITEMEEEARQGPAELSHSPQHIADRGSDADMHDRVRDLAENDRNLLYEIDGALRRIEEGAYGICEATGKPIPKERLDIEPWARYTVEAERDFERGESESRTLGRGG